MSLHKLCGKAGQLSWTHTASLVGHYGLACTHNLQRPGQPGKKVSSSWLPCISVATLESSPGRCAECDVQFGQEDRAWCDHVGVIR